ncbi:stalk domain-containing protein [Paenibacillus hexagrammi]
MKSVALAALTCGMILGGTAAAYAASNLEEIKAYLNHTITFEINGKAWQPPVDPDTDQALVPITYQGSTYVPLRALANALDQPVDYDDANKKVWIGQMIDGVSHESPVVSFSYTDDQLKDIQKTFWFTANLPAKLVKGDAFLEAGYDDVDGGCWLKYKHLTIGQGRSYYLIPDDVEQNVTLANGTKAYWMKDGNLSFPFGDVNITMKSEDLSLSHKQIEEIAASMYESPLKVVDASQFAGRTFTKQGSDKYDTSTIQIKKMDADSVTFSVMATHAVGGDAGIQNGNVHTGTIDDTTVKIFGRNAEYSTESPAYDLIFEFNHDGTIQVTEQGESGFGQGVQLSGLYTPSK